MARNPKSGDMTTREAGRLGGEKVRDKYGVEFYSEIGHKGGEIGGRKGGNTTKQKYGPEFYSQIGKKGGNKVRDLINAGKRAMEE
ncbi:Glucose starvation-inducible protein B [compost metagenome]|jgi:hypothetical protein